MVKILIFGLLSLISIAKGVKPFDDLRARLSTNKTRYSFFRLPKTTESCQIKNYVKVRVDFELPLDFYCYPNDPRLCLMYDKKGNVAGVQLSILYEDVRHVKKYDYSKIEEYEFTDFFNKPAWSVRVYFTNPEKLTSAGRKPTDEVAEGVWIYLKGKLTEIPRKESKIGQAGPFPEQGCVPRAGNIYMYNLEQSVSCNKLFPFYAYYFKKSLIGIGMGFFGQGSIENKLWYTEQPIDRLAEYLPNHPSCFLDWAEGYGFPSLTVFLVDQPWKHTCSY